MIFLFTDFGAADIYVGQVKSVLHRHAPEAAVIDLFHEAPRFDAKSGAHLLAALVHRLPEESVIVAVVDPGVGSTRTPVMVQSDHRWYVGPDNGLLSVVTARAETTRVYTIDWKPEHLSMSFHGRDLFAVAAANIARGRLLTGGQEPRSRLDVELGAGDLPAIIYIDHFGNAFTGLRAASIPQGARFIIDGHMICGANVFSDVPQGGLFWYENSIGLAEIAANCDSAANKLKLEVGCLLTLDTD